MSGPQPLGAFDRKWMEKAEELRFNELDRVRAAAEKWAGSIAALTGVLGMITLIKGPEDVSNLSSNYRTVVGIALGLAVLGASVGILLAGLAAQGVPKEMWVTGAEVREASRTGAARATKFLAWSRGLVAFSVVALSSAVGFTWFGKKQAAAPPADRILAVERSGTVLCGTLVEGDGGKMAVKVKDGSVMILNDILSVTLTENCP